MRRRKVDAHKPYGGEGARGGKRGKRGKVHVGRIIGLLPSLLLTRKRKDAVL